MKALPSAPFALAIVVLMILALTGCDDDTVYVEDGPPAIPAGVTTITGDGWVEILWYPVREDDVAGYGVYRSNSLDGRYDRIATVQGVENTSFVDHEVLNGVTYFYAVDAFDDAGHESALSYEDAFDTPRPAGTGVTVFALQVDPTNSGLDFSDWATGGFVAGWSAPDTDVYVHRLDGVLYAKGTLNGDGYWNDIQDLGWTESMDDVSWAPADGWSVSPNGVELIRGHTYVVWTHDSYFAKFRVVSVVSGGTPSAIVIDWAYQIDQDNPELKALPVRRASVSAPERGDS